MAEKMLDSTQAGMKRSSSNPPSIFGTESHELVWENGQILVHGGSDKRPAAIGSGYICKPFTQHCLPSTPLKKPRIDSNQITLATKNVLRPSLFLKSTHNENSATTDYTVLASMEHIKATKVGKATTGSKTPDHDSVVIDSSKGSHGFTGLKEQTPLVSDASNQVSFVARSEEPLPDENSEAAGHKSALHGSHAQYYNQTSTSAGLGANEKAATNFCNEPLIQSSSVCSLGASNNTNLCSMKYEETDESAYLSDNDEEQEEVVKEKPEWEGNRTRVKRSRDTKNHSLNERKRRDMINKRMRVLKELIPNCNKVDQASMLDDAINYLKNLKFQLQIMSMGRGLCMPLMMLPSAAHHFMGAGMGFRPGTNIPQFPIPPLPPGVTDNRAQMFGFPNQMPPMPMSHAPFMPMLGNPSTQPIQGTNTATNLGENLASVPNNFYLDGQA